MRNFAVGNGRRETESNEAAKAIVAAGGWAMHGEGDDLVPAFVKRVVESPQRPDGVGVGARSPKNVSEPLPHRGAIGRGENPAKLLLDLVGGDEAFVLGTDLQK